MVGSQFVSTCSSGTVAVFASAAYPQAQQLNINKVYKVGLIAKSIIHTAWQKTSLQLKKAGILLPFYVVPYNKIIAAWIRGRRGCRPRA